MLPGRADALPVDPRPPRPRRPRPVEPAGRGHRRGRHPGRAHPADRRRAAVLGRSSPATGSPRAARRRRPRPDDDAETIATTVGRPRPGFELRIVDGERRRRRRRASRARSCCGAAASCRTTSTIRRRPPQALSRRRVAAHRRPRRRRRRRVPADRRPVEGHVHRRRLQRLPGRDRERPAAPPRRPAGGGDRRPRRAPRRGRHGLRRARARRDGHRPTEIIEWSRDADGQLQGARGPSRSSTSCPLNATGKVEKDVLRDRVASAAPASTS